MTHVMDQRHVAGGSRGGGSTTAAVVAAIRNKWKACKLIITKWHVKSISSVKINEASRFKGENGEIRKNVGNSKEENSHSSKKGEKSGTDRTRGSQEIFRDDNCFSFLRSASTKSSKPRGDDATPKVSYFFRCRSSKETPSPTIPTNPNIAARTLSRRSSSRIYFSRSMGLEKPKAPPMEKTLECSLEDLCFGCTKEITISRNVVTDTGEINLEEEVLSVQVMQGWIKGTKLTFEGMGDEKLGMDRGDLNLVVVEKGHSLFRREGDDLELTLEVPLIEALTGCTLSIPLLGGETTTLTIDQVIYPGYEEVFPRQGMPKTESPERRGDLKVVFLVAFPRDLTDQQRSEAVSILRDCC